MAISDDLVAVGSQSHVSLVDPRCQAPVQDVPSLDMDHGEGPWFIPRRRAVHVVARLPISGSFHARSQLMPLSCLLFSQ